MMELNSNDTALVLLAIKHGGRQQLRRLSTPPTQRGLALFCCRAPETKGHYPVKFKERRVMEVRAVMCGLEDEQLLYNHNHQNCYNNGRSEVYQKGNFGKLFMSTCAVFTMKNGF